MNMDEYYQMSDEKKASRGVTIQRLAHSLIENSKGELEPYQAEMRVRGLLERPIPELLGDIKSSILAALPTERNGRRVGYIFSLMVTEVAPVEPGQPTMAKMMLSPPNQAEIILPADSPQGNENKWLVMGGNNLDLHLASLLGRAESFAPYRFVHLVAVEHDASAIALMATPFYHGQQFPAYRALSWSIRDGWLWEGEDLVTHLGEGIPFEEAPSIINIMDSRRQARLEAVFKAETILSEIQEKASEGMNHVMNYIPKRGLTAHYSFTKKGDEVTLRESFPGARSAVAEQIALVLGDPGSRGQIVLENRSEVSEISVWEYSAETGFTPMNPEKLEMIIKRSEEMLGHLADTATPKLFPDPFTLDEKPEKTLE